MKHLALLGLAAVAIPLAYQGATVSLQASSPGTQQVGNANISGRVIAGSVLSENASPTAQVIVGNATATNGANFGGFFRSDSVLGRAPYGRASATSGTTHGVWGQADSPGGRGVTGVAPATTGNATGVWGQTASTTGRGIYGYTTSGSGVNYGVFGHTSSPEGYGVFSQGNMHATGVISGNGLGLTNLNASHVGTGTLSAARLPVPLSLSGSLDNTTAMIRGQNSSSHYGIGVAGYATAASGLTHGVRGHSASVLGVGVFGWATASSGVTYGGRFTSSSPDGSGAFGRAEASSGVTTGVRGESISPTGRGVAGNATASSGQSYGGWFEVVSTSGRGVFGWSKATSGTNYGVRGQSQSSTGFGVFSAGNTGASGTKSFRIDHPFDPENKYLLHFSTEMPEPQNAYNGVVTTDANGEAWVQLPDYFGEINKDFKYQLTVVDDTDSDQFLMAKVAREIRQNKFKIRTNAPRVKVSWEVKAIRNDLWVRKNGARVEVDKEGPEKGQYQHPELYGFGPERGMEYVGERPRQQPPTER